MRTLKFRGQDYQRHWHYGSHVVFNDGSVAIAENDPTWTDDGYHNDDFDIIKVRLETVGQFIEKIDKSKQEIYDGDIVLSEYGEKVEVFWDGTCWGLRDTHKKDYFGCPQMYDFKKFHFEKATVIGNIHDNLK